MLKKYIIAITTIFMLNSATSQEIISTQLLESWTKAEITSTFFIQAQYDVELYAITYTTKGIDMEKDTASGSFALALDSDTKFPLLVYEHGTVGNRNAVPSKGSYEAGFTIAFAASGYHCIAPDFIGLGVSKGLHPYLHPESEAWATIDMIKAIKTMESDEIHFNDQLFITGYSQGGHAAMATCRAIQESEPGLNVTAASPMSGPYSISEKMKDFTLKSDSYSFCGYIGSVFLTAKYVYPDLMDGIEVEDVFKPVYAEMIRSFEAEEEDLFDVNTSMINTLSATEGAIKPALMLKESVRNLILDDDTYALNIALARMNVTDWIPESPIQMVYCLADDQVTAQNAIYTDSLMTAGGATDVSIVDANSAGTHGTCVFPAILKTRDFFAPFQVLSGNNDLKGNASRSITLTPNPTYGVFTIDMSKLENENYDRVIIRNMSGQVVKNVVLDRKYDITINLEGVSSGLHIVEIHEKNEVIAREKLLVL